MKLWHYCWCFEDNGWHDTNFLWYEVGTNVIERMSTKVPTIGTVVPDGLTFQFDPGGTKVVRQKYMGREMDQI